MSTNGIPDLATISAAKNAQKKAGLVNIALTITCQMKVDEHTPQQGRDTFQKANAIVSDLLDEYTGVKDAEVKISNAPQQ